MPNYVKAKLQVSGENTKELIDSLCEVCKDGHKRFDFNKIIPMPDELRICCGGPTESCMKLFINSLPMGFSAHTKYVKAYVAYKNSQPRFSLFNAKLDDIPIMNEDEINSMLEDLIKRYTKERQFDSDDPVFNTKEDVFAYGKRALDNYLIYGYLDWYDWSRDHWGTKWNACDCYVTDSEIEFSTAWSNVVGLIVELSIQHPDYEFYYEYADEDTGCQVGYIRVKGGEFIESVVYDNCSKEAYEQAVRIWGCGDDYEYDEKEGTYKWREDA